ncbi:molybdate ABC transporter substrate-binding protein [Agromyces sp. CFH 90414]|uniref:Molybdate ABC transporter substrate-binding protein n=1 Tax=Agromyces agglutinans TaxID=2662258 RepID=A0A6I2FA74_9MICO|nr:molybdate ABC transporter substrate-binding protein [Agromyces agglutinans]MRG61144.1 molybdate ABC transporter substrate-binding protein [Agromyces agglutinans]
MTGSGPEAGSRVRPHRAGVGTARVAAALAGFACVVALAGCAPGGSDVSPAASADRDRAALTGEVTVYAAASLAGAFEELGADFEAEHPGVDIRPIVADGSSTLAAQLVEGAPADVFASADERTMTTVDDAGLITGDPHPFATNTLRIVVPAGNPGELDAIEDLADPGLAVVLCAPEVPCGAASEQLLALDGVEVTPVSEEQNVTAVLTKVRSGEADAGLVYATDVEGAGTIGAADVESVMPARADEVVNRYPIAALADAGNPAAAAAFVDFVRGERGRAVLEARGFGAP